MAEINRRVISMCSGLCRAGALIRLKVLRRRERTEAYARHMFTLIIATSASEGASIGCVSITHEMFISYAEM